MSKQRFGFLFRRPKKSSFHQGAPLKPSHEMSPAEVTAEIKEHVARLQEAGKLPVLKPTTETLRAPRPKSHGCLTKVAKTTTVGYAFSRAKQ